MADRTGIVDQARQALDAADPPLLQPALFPAADLGAVPTGHDRAAVLKERRGAGRPPGAMNRRTAAFRDYVLARGVHPADVLIETYSRPVHDLARELGCTLLEAHQAQRDAARIILEYTEGKMPVRVDIGAEGGVNLFIGSFAQAAEPAKKDEYFQGVTIDAGGDANGDVSNGGT